LYSGQWKSSLFWTEENFTVNGKDEFLNLHCILDNVLNSGRYHNVFWTEENFTVNGKYKFLNLHCIIDSGRDHNVLLTEENFSHEC